VGASAFRSAAKLALSRRVNVLLLAFALVMALCGLERAHAESHEHGYWREPAYHPQLVAPVPHGLEDPLQVVVALPSSPVANPLARNGLRTRGVLLAGGLGLAPVVVWQLMSPNASSLLEFVAQALRGA